MFLRSDATLTAHSTAADGRSVTSDTLFIQSAPHEIHLPVPHSEAGVRAARLQAWAAVRVGMTRDEVVSLLGPPHHERYRGGKPRPDASLYSYGYLQLPYVHHPRTYSFMIGFDDEGCVNYKEDPFGGRFSIDGSPTVPKIITPLEQSVFNHYPRVVDLRWYPSSAFIR